MIDYRHFLYRTQEFNEGRERIEAIWTPVAGRAFQHPWRESLQDSKLESIWFDLVELYDFVPEAQKEQVNAAD